MNLKNVFRGRALSIAIGIMTLSISRLLGWTNALPNDGGKAGFTSGITINN